jgi:flagellar basal body-associated protein FliL
MRLKEDVYSLKQELGDIRQESFAMELIRESNAKNKIYEKQNKILFVIILILLVFLIATCSYLIWVLNDIGTEEITTEESYEVQQEADGNNNYINGSENSVNNG